MPKSASCAGQLAAELLAAEDLLRASCKRALHIGGDWGLRRHLEILTCYLATVAICQFSAEDARQLLSETFDSVADIEQIRAERAA